MSLKLFGYWRSSATWRVRWALNLKGQSYSYMPVNLKAGAQQQTEYLKVNPAGLVPLLLTPEGLRLTQSLAILAYLDALNPIHDLFPKEAPLRFRALELWEVIAADTHPLQNLSVQQRHSADPKAQKEWSQFFIRRGLGNYNFVLSELPQKTTFSLGESPTLPDLALIPQIYNAQRFGVDVKAEFPRLWDMYTAAMATSACLSASPEKQVDAVTDS